MNPPSISVPPLPPTAAPGRGCRNALVVALFLVILLLIAGVAFVRRTFNAKPFAPVALTPPEQTVLETKVEWVEATADGKDTTAPTPPAAPAAAPDPRLLVLSEKEINALLSNRPELKEFQGNLRFDLREGQIHIDANLPVPAEVPVMGGKNIRVTWRANGSYADGKLSLVIVSATLGGIEVPNAWVGNLKGRDLGQEFQAKPNQSPGLAHFLTGVETIRVKDDRIEVRLKE